VFEPSSPTGQPLASAGMRVLARFLDGLILGAIGYAIGYAVLSGDDSAGFGGVGGDASFGKLYLIGLLGIAIGFVWDAVCTKLFGGTPMKLAFGMRVVRADNGEPVEWSHAIIRWAIPGALAIIPLPVLPGLINLVIVIVSLVFIFTKPLRQAVWDQIAKTLVVKPA
jgi:uncharacterized RDD family membrane protein YckC